MLSFCTLLMLSAIFSNFSRSFFTRSEVCLWHPRTRGAPGKLVDVRLSGPLGRLAQSLVRYETMSYMSSHLFKWVGGWVARAHGTDTSEAGWSMRGIMARAPLTGFL